MTRSNSLRTIGLSLALMACGHFVSYAQSTLSQNQDGFNGERMDGFMDSGPDADTTVIEREVSKDYWQWTIDPVTALPVRIEPDTLHHAFQYVHLTEGMKGTYSHLGNMGSPRQSRLFFERGEIEDFMFDAPYDFWVKTPYDFRFTDAKSPHLSLDYYKGGDKRTGEEHLKGYFVANFNRKSGIGLNMDYQLGRGRYLNQSTSMFDTRLYTYWRGDRYTMYLSGNRDNMKITENGGLFDERYITSPEAMAEGRKQYSPEDIYTRLSDNWNNIKHSQLLFNQSIDISYKFSRTDSIGDTVLTYNGRKQLGKLAHNLEVGHLKRRYLSYNVPDGFYERAFVRPDSLDPAEEFYVSNTLSLSLAEGSTKWAIAGLTGYLRHEYRSFHMPDTLSNGNEYYKHENEFDLFAGGKLEKAKGDFLHFGASFETAIAGASLGDFSLDGSIALVSKLFGKPASIGASASVSATSAPYFMESFHSTYAWWDNDFDKEIRSGIQAFAEIEATGTRIQVDVVNIGNYIYLENKGGMFVNTDSVLQPTYAVSSSQHDGQIQVLSATASQNFRLGPLHWDNSITWQKSSNSRIIPLPELNIFSDLYVKFLYYKRLNMEIGVNCTYFTKYDAPSYCPAAGMYHLQNSDFCRSVGGYPLLTGYANCSLRGVRFYVMYYHANYGIMKNSDCFILPGYPANPGMLKFGLSWTFFD